MSRINRGTSIGVRVSKLVKASSQTGASPSGLEPVLINPAAHANFVRNVFALRAKTTIIAPPRKAKGESEAQAASLLDG